MLGGPGAGLAVQLKERGWEVVRDEECVDSACLRNGCFDTVVCRFSGGTWSRMARPQVRSANKVRGPEGGPGAKTVERENTEMKRLLGVVAAGDAGGAFTSLVGPKGFFV